jgi:predicted Mrr-cat superfamily restriction endonuclease
MASTLLKELGYRTIDLKEAQDEGTEITGHCYKLKLEQPAIKVQVKSGDGKVGREKPIRLASILAPGHLH